MNPWREMDDDEGYDDWLNELLENTPESYDCDDAAEAVTHRKVQFVRTAGRSWRFGPWPISYGWGFDVGRWRLVVRRA